VERPAQWVRAWKPEVPGIHEVFHARFVDHTYPAHTHDAWTVFTVGEGSIAYDLERRHRGVEDRGHAPASGRRRAGRLRSVARPRLRVAARGRTAPRRDEAGEVRGGRMISPAAANVALHEASNPFEAVAHLVIA